MMIDGNLQKSKNLDENTQMALLLIMNKANISTNENITNIIKREQYHTFLAFK